MRAYASDNKSEPRAQKKIEIKKKKRAKRAQPKPENGPRSYLNNALAGFLHPAGADAEIAPVADIDDGWRAAAGAAGAAVGAVAAAGVVT